ncbi:MAG: GNAT family N-acetyltransferase [Clostridia bacterium]|nr:GNAT family N-acetyltransferase [Clostridia bacterium]
MTAEIKKSIEILRDMGLFDSAGEVNAAAFRSAEDGAEYNVWKLSCGEKNYVLKKAKNYELEVYSAFFGEGIYGVPKFVASFKSEEEDYFITEYVEGEDLCTCNREKLISALDALISLQSRYWDDQSHENVGYTYEKSLESRRKRRNYLMDEELERTYDDFLAVYETLPRTLCHDDLLPFNVIANNDSAAIIDWEYAGILPYPASLARLIAHTGEEDDAFFKMSEMDKEGAISYYYTNLVKKHGIPYGKFRRALDLFIFYELTEWIMLANKYPDGNKKRGEEYMRKARELIKRMDTPKPKVELPKVIKGKSFMKMKYGNLTVRKAEASDAKQLTAWWNDGAVMAHAGFPNGLGTTEEEVIAKLRDGLYVILENERLIGECNWRNVADGVAEIGIKICETDCQNRGVGRKVLSMLIDELFRTGYSKIVLDTNLTNTRAQHVYESLGFCKVRTNIDSWKNQLGQLQSSVDYELVEKDFVSYIDY